LVPRECRLRGALPRASSRHVLAANGFAPDGPQWLYELKRDGYLAIAFNRAGVVHLRSSNNNKKAGDVVRE
jgi:hypothetical protein